MTWCVFWTLQYSSVGTKEDECIHDFHNSVLSLWHWYKCCGSRGLECWAACSRQAEVWISRKNRIGTSFSHPSLFLLSVRLETSLRESHLGIPSVRLLPLGFREWGLAQLTALHTGLFAFPCSFQYGGILSQGQPDLGEHKPFQVLWLQFPVFVFRSTHLLTKFCLCCCVLLSRDNVVYVVKNHHELLQMKGDILSHKWLLLYLFFLHTKYVLFAFFPRCYLLSSSYLPSVLNLVFKNCWAKPLLWCC